MLVEMKTPTLTLRADRASKFRLVETKDAHETSNMADDLRGEIMGLLMEPPVGDRGPPLPRDSRPGDIDETRLVAMKVRGVTELKVRSSAGFTAEHANSA